MAVVVVAAAVVVVAGVVALPVCLACPGGMKDAFGQSLPVVPVVFPMLPKAANMTVVPMPVLVGTRYRKGLRLRTASM